MGHLHRMPADLARQRQGIGHGRLISDDSESDIRIEIESLNAQVTRAAYFEHGLGFSRPQRIVEFIECDDGAFWHAWHKMLQRRLGRLIQIKIQEQQADQRREREATRDRARKLSELSVGRPSEVPKEASRLATASALLDL